MSAVSKIHGVRRAGSESQIFGNIAKNAIRGLKTHVDGVLESCETIGIENLNVDKLIDNYELHDGIPIVEDLEPQLKDPQKVSELKRKLHSGRIDNVSDLMKTSPLYLVSKGVTKQEINVLLCAVSYAFANTGSYIGDVVEVPTTGHGCEDPIATFFVFHPERFY